MTTQQPQPVRSSLLFSPVASTNGPASPSDRQQITDLDSTNDTSQQFQHHRRRSDFRSKSTDQIIPISSFNPTNISSTTLYASPTPGKFSNVNVSQPALRPAPMAPVPIPATRFDTITSYVDVIYQHQQQQLQQQQQQSSSHSQANSRSQPADPSQQQGRSSVDQEDVESQNMLHLDNGVVYLDPSDGIDGDESFMATCPQCTMMVMTEIDPFPGNKSRRMACLLTPLFLCWLPFSSSFKIGRRWMNVKHTCPKCQSTIAIYRK